MDDDFKDRYRHVWESLEQEDKALAQEKKKLSEEWVVIEKYQQCYEQDRATFEAMVHDKFAFLPEDEMVQFNIGGKLFKSTVKVWTRDRFSILAHVCTATPKLARDSRGHFYFDRDWWIFKYIYAFLRDKTLPDSIDVLRDLYYEASFYRITLLRHAIEAFLKNQSTAGQSDVRKGRNDHGGYVTSDDLYRQPKDRVASATVPTMPEREWASGNSTAAGGGNKPLAPKLARRPSMTKHHNNEPELRSAPPRVHPFHQEETKSRLNIHVPSQPSYMNHTYDQQPPYDPALDFIDRRQQHHHHQHPSDYYSTTHNIGQHDDRHRSWQDEYDHDPRRRDGFEGDGGGRRGSRKQPHLAFDPHRDTYHRDHQDARRPYEHDVAGRGPSSYAKHDHPLRRPESYNHDPRRGGGPPLSPPLADPYGFLSRRKHSSM
ncbi:hypothetical protein H257_10874 [Aphanomyces astaci]|uniref:Potassium channel tetramerisation-type BTB domain-containing protein n=1 Tax=Aphanomyces astaci TaxID=112090 RepID=W4G550_APHAT|nr:hypothetical protein H257_10874 [Aphanomyces astaci]ETV74810.1 hypothetical protein H257_10874 [Aphanomyces astaci]|eukprot:XP_009835897.1 hypothetical protein H257_10874 [Aphanomyces astaci]